MLELVGLLLLGATFVSLETLVPWLRQERLVPVVRRLMLNQILAMVLFGCGVFGGAIVFVELVEVWRDPDAARIVAAYAAALIGMPAILKGSRWLGVLTTRRLALALASARPIVP